MIQNLQLLRAFAALNVVLFHAIGTSASYDYETNFISALKGWGANGVDIFFVISGFVMLLSQLENKRSVKDFLVLRAIRIVPIYWLLTLSVIALAIFTPSLLRSGGVISMESLLASLGFLSQAITGKAPVVYVGWSLEWEMLFYLVFGLSLYFRSWKATLITTFSVLLGISLFTSFLMLLEFIAGMCIAILYKCYGWRSYGKLALFLGVLLLFSSLLDNVRLLIDNRVILWGVPSTFIVYGVISVEQIRSTIGKLLGDASYSIYLMQMFSIPAYYKFLTALKIQLNNDLLIVICLVATALGGVAMYLLIEKPMLSFLKSRIFAHKNASKAKGI